MPERFWNMSGAHAGGTLVTIVHCRALRLCIFFWGAVSINFEKSAIIKG
jgi:hypothetical protein